MRATPSSWFEARKYTTYEIHFHCRLQWRLLRLVVRAHASPRSVECIRHCGTLTDEEFPAQKLRLLGLS